jgi:enoyl-CoA hydratase/carnithine racemase
LILDRSSTNGAAPKGATSPATVRTEQHGEVLVVRIDRVAKRNALDEATLLDLEAAVAAPQDARAIVLCASGEHFCAGLDLSELTERDASEGVRHSRQWHRVFDRIQYGAVPVVAVLHGAVIGGGLELAAAAHVRVAERSVFYALPEATRGIFVGGGASVRLPVMIGVARVTEMMLTGRVVRGEEGQHIGLSHYLVEPGAGLELAMKLARRIAENAPMTNYAVMHVLPRIAELGHDQGLVMESLIAALSQGAPEAKRRMREFLEKRAPKVGEPPEARDE